jgi:hypothetical protein
VGDLFPALVGLVGVVVGAIVSGVVTSRRAEIAEAHAEPREAYLAGLAALDSLTPMCRKMYQCVSDGSLELAFRDRYDGDPAVRAEAEAVIRTIGSELERIGPDLRRLDLLAGTPVLSAVRALLYPLGMIMHELESWLAGNHEERQQLHGRTSALFLYNPEKVTEAMRTDLGRPWPVQYHDRGQYRWWRMWRR